MTNKIKMITFDLDDTLWDNKPTITNAEIKTREWIEDRVGTIEWGDLNDFLQLRETLIKKDRSITWDISKLRIEIFKEKIKGLASADDITKLAEDAFDYFLKKRHEIKLFPGVESALKTLSENYTLGVLTNGNADIYKLSIGKYFEFSISSLEAQNSKPNKSHFELAKSRLPNLKYSEMLHIGDHQINDVTGALNAGMHAVWFNKDAAEWAQNYNQPTTFSDWYNYQKIEELSI